MITLNPNMSCHILSVCTRFQIDISEYVENNANLKDLIAATSPVILLKLDSNRRFFGSCDLEIGWMALI